MNEPSGEHRLRIAMIGLRGVPATYGGVERHVEELGWRLADRGHEVTVYCRNNYGEGRARRHRGMHLRHLPAPGNKVLENIAHSGLSSMDAVRRGYDVVHYHAIGSGLTAPLIRSCTRSGVVLTVHGLDGDRAKWSLPAQSVLRLATWMSARVPHATITVSEDLQRHYLSRYDRPTAYVPNGVEPGVPRPAGALLERLGLAPHAYALFVGRFVPEKAPDRLIRAFRGVSDPDLRLVLAGGSSFTDAYTALLGALARNDPRVVLPGYVYGEDLRELYSNAGVFVNPSDLEGLPITLLEACSHGLPVVASDIPPHLEVLGSDAPGRRLFRAGDDASLVAALRRWRTDGPNATEGAAALRAEVLDRYSWDAIVDETVRIYRSVLRARTSTTPV